VRTPGIDERERLLTLSALASVALILGLLVDRAAIGAEVALAFPLGSLFLPVPAAWFVAGWKAVTHRLFRLVTSVLLIAVHVLVVTPIGLLRRLRRRGPAPTSTFVPAEEPEAGPDPASWERPG
jgi:hypothetical protein